MKLPIIVMATCLIVVSMASAQKKRDMTNSESLIFMYQLNNGQGLNIVDKANRVSLDDDKNGKCMS